MSARKNGKKENLILVHSFPTNSILLAGLTEYLDDFFNVYFIDLPGFTGEVRPLKRVSLKRYSNFLNSKIKKLNLNHFVIGGISFGFAVVNDVNLDKRKCRAIFAIEPYINCEYLHQGFIQRFLYTHMLEAFVHKPSAIDRVWHSDFSKRVLAFLSGQTAERMDMIMKEIDGRTFFNTALCIIENKKDIKFKKDIPYVLFVNNNDETVAAAKIVALFEKSIPQNNLLVIYTDIDHYPKDVSKKYFKSKLSDKKVKTVVSWLSQKIT